MSTVCVWYNEEKCCKQSKMLDPDPTKARYWLCLSVEGGGEVAGQSYSKKQCGEEGRRLDSGDYYGWNQLGNAGDGEVAGKSYNAKQCY